jgi:adenylate cyclase
MASREYQVSLDYQFDHSVEEVWNYVSNTDRINRMLKLPPVKYSFFPRPEGGTNMIGEFRVKGLLIRWKEHPYEWVKNQFFKIEREYFTGPIEYIRIDWNFEKTANGCKLRQTFKYRLVNRLFKPFAILQIDHDGRKGFRKCYDIINQHLKRKASGEASEAFPVSEFKPNPKVMKVFKERLRQSDVNEESSDQLLNYIFTAQDHDVATIRPFRVAEKLKLSRMDSLAALLKATKSGLLSLSWKALCPGCRGAKESAGVLSQLSAEIHCNSCNIRFAADFSNRVELTFSPKDSVRKVGSQEFCAGSPRNTPHLQTQLRLSPKRDVAFKLDLPVGTYRLRSLQSNMTWSLEVQNFSENIDNRFNAVFKSGSHETEQQLISVTKGTIQFQIENQTDHELTVVLERATWMDDVCTAALVSSLPEFRQIFSSQILDLGAKVEFSSMAVLFTDLKGSTALYEKSGDAHAFAVIQKHFSILQLCVQQSEGGVVKTIGDAVMAVFSQPENALKAAIAIQNSTFADGIEVKVSIHYGPCFLYRLNDILDYFGSTVNLAARLQGHCEGGEVTLSAKMIDDPAVRATLRSHQLVAEQSSKNFKGFEDEIEVYRISRKQNQRAA